MKFFTLITTILLFPLSLLAEDTWQNDIIEIAEKFSDLAEQQEVIEYSIEHMYPEVLVAMARAFNASDTDMLQDMRAGYATAKTIVEMLDHEVFVEMAQFGVSEDWQWGFVPYQSALTIRTTRVPLPLSCSWLFVFGKDGEWFFNSIGSVRSKEILNSALPSSLLSAIDNLSDPVCLQ